MSTYSFLDVTLSISGPNGNFHIGGPDTSSAEEGFSITYTDDADTMIGGADEGFMHALSATKRARVDVHLLKGSPINAMLSDMYHADRQSGSQRWGQNTLVARNPISGDQYTGVGAAFVKFPDNTYGRAPNVITWSFNVGKMDADLGALMPQP